jgi:hypothetical protein
MYDAITTNRAYDVRPSGRRIAGSPLGTEVGMEAAPKGVMAADIKA